MSAGMKVSRRDRQNFVRIMDEREQPAAVYSRRLFDRTITRINVDLFAVKSDFVQRLKSLFLIEEKRPENLIRYSVFEIFVDIGIYSWNPIKIFIFIPPKNAKFDRLFVIRNFHPNKNFTDR